MNASTGFGPYVAIGSRMKGIPEVSTLGVRPNFHDYSLPERALMMRAPLILYPTLNYAQFFQTMGKEIFPSVETCLYSDEKIKQTTLFYMLRISHPQTRFFYHLHHHQILEHFSFPFVAKLPRSSARGRGVFKIEDHGSLEQYLKRTNIAYIQEYLPHERDLRVILINYEPVLAYWRKKSPRDFRANLFQGGTIDFRGIPQEALEIARAAVRKCRFNDVGLDMIEHQGRWYVIEANMNYGREGLKTKGLDLKKVLREKLLSGELTALLSNKKIPSEGDPDLK